MASNKRSLPKIKTQKEWKSKYDFLSFDTQLLCTKYKDEITSCKNYNPSFIDGSDNFRLSSVTKPPICIKRLVSLRCKKTVVTEY